jgi:hypothetical protein
VICTSRSERAVVKAKFVGPQIARNISYRDLKNVFGNETDQL